MSEKNKQTAPKELWIHQSDVKELNTYMLASNALIHSIVRGNMDNSEYTKYLSETHFNELLKSKDKEITGLAKLLSEKNAEIAEKDFKINDLIKERDRLRKLTKF